VRGDCRSSLGRPLPNVGVCEAQDTCPQHIAPVDGLGSLRGRDAVSLCPRDAVSLCPSQSPRHSDVTVLGSWLGLNAWAPAAAGILEGRAPYLHQVFLLHRLCCCAIAEKRVIHTPATHVSYTHMDPFQKQAHTISRSGKRRAETVLEKMTRHRHSDSTARLGIDTEIGPDFQTASRLLCRLLRLRCTRSPNKHATATSGICID